MSKNQPLKPKSNNEKLFIGLIIGAGIGFLIFLILGIVSVHSEIVFLILLSIFIVVTLIFLVIVWFRGRIIKRFFRKDIEFDTLVDDTQETIDLITLNLTEKLPIEEEEKEKLKVFAPKLINYMLWSNFRNWGLRIFISFIIGLGGIVTTVLIVNQNKLFENQNKRIEQQTHLIEADRRSAQVFIMGDVLSDIYKELENPKNEERTLSSSLIGRISSLSRAMKPYKYLRGDSLIERPLSPERGQFLIALIQSRMNSNTLDRIILNADFSQSEIIGANFEHAQLSTINLSASDLRNTSFHQADLSLANLSGANLEGADLRSTDFFYADLSGIISLDSAKVDRPNWLLYMRDTLEPKGAKKIFSEYKIENVLYKDTNPRFVWARKMPMLLKKDEK